MDDISQTEQILEVSKRQNCQRVNIPLEENDRQVKPKRIRHKIIISLIYFKKVEETVKNQKNDEGNWNVCNEVRFSTLQED